MRCRVVLVERGKLRIMLISTTVGTIKYTSHLKYLHSASICESLAVKRCMIPSYASNRNHSRICREQALVRAHSVYSTMCAFSVHFYLCMCVSGESFLFYHVQSNRWMILLSTVHMVFLNQHTEYPVLNVKLFLLPQHQPIYVL